MLRWPYLQRLGTLLVQLATCLRAPLYVDHYLRDLGSVCLTPAASALLSRAAVADSSGGGDGGAHPADIQRALLALLEGKGGHVRVTPMANDIGVFNSPLAMAAQGLRPLAGNGLPLIPALASARSPEVYRSVQLLMLYGILSRSETTCTTLLAAQRAEADSGKTPIHHLQVCMQLKPHTIDTCG